MSEIDNSSKIKPPSNIPAIRTMMMPSHTNPNGTIFGGIILSYIDQAGSIEAMRQAPHVYVTAKMNEVNFRRPVMVGDILSCWAKTTAIGNTSITIAVDVFACHSDAIGKKKIHVTSAEVVYVAIDRSGRPTSVFDLDENDD